MRRAGLRRATRGPFAGWADGRGAGAGVLAGLRCNERKIAAKAGK